MKEMIGFLVNAKKNTYAANAKQCGPCRKGSKDSAYRMGDYAYYDSYFGSKQFIGEEIVWKNGQAIWGLNYDGAAIDADFDFAFLQKALSEVAEDYPFRGPKEFAEGNYRYECNVSGDIERFVGTEDIYCDAQHIYHCDFHGGRISP